MDEKMTKKTFYSEHDLDALGILSRATRWRMRQKGEFPNPIKLSQGRVAYPAFTIEAWIKERITASAPEAS